jgi:hypothetical protein
MLQSKKEQGWTKKQGRKDRNRNGKKAYLYVNGNKKMHQNR